MTIANPVNPRKKFLWGLEFDGLEPALAQKVKMPTIEIDVAEHGASNIMIKTGGKVKIGDIEVTKLMHQNKNENWAYDWMKLVSNPENGQMGIPSVYKRNGYIIHYAADGETVLEKWECIGCFPKKKEHDELDKTSTADNLMEMVTLSCDYVVRTS